MNHSQLITSLEHHAPVEEIQRKIEVFRRAAKDFALALNTDTPDGRAKSLAQTKLEECVMWAIKGMVVPGA